MSSRTLGAINHGFSGCVRSNFWRSTVLSGGAAVMMLISLASRQLRHFQIEPRGAVCKIFRLVEFQGVHDFAFGKFGGGAQQQFSQFIAVRPAYLLVRPLAFRVGIG